MENLKNKIKELRLEQNLTQVQMANKIGFAQSTIAQWENGIKLPSLEAVVILAKFFNCYTDYLLGLED